MFEARIPRCEAEELVSVCTILLRIEWFNSRSAFPYLLVELTEVEPNVTELHIDLSIGSIICEYWSLKLLQHFYKDVLSHPLVCEWYCVCKSEYQLPFVTRETFVDHRGLIYAHSYDNHNNFTFLLLKS